MNTYEPCDQPETAAPRRRPATVLLAAALMVLTAALTAASAILVLAMSGTIPREFRGNAFGSGASPSDIDGIATGIQAVMITSGIVGLGLAVAIGLLALGVLRGSNGARITTVVVLAAGACCGLGAALGSSATRNADVNVRDTDAQTAENLGRALTEAVPGWFVGLTVGLNCLAVLGYLAVVVLLFLAPSNAYFRRVPAGQRPPTPPPPPSG